MTKEEVFKQLKPYGCISVYLTGSSANPYIKSPNDCEMYAIFNTEEEAILAPKIYNVFKIHKTWEQVKPQIWSYLFHYINHQGKYIGEQILFKECDLNILIGMANNIINNKIYNKDFLFKNYYHVAMIKSIEKYGYENIPNNIVKMINDIHDLKITYKDFMSKKLKNNKGGK